MKTVNLATKHTTNSTNQIYIHASQWKPQSTSEPTRLTSKWLWIKNTYGSAGEELKKRAAGEKSPGKERQMAGEARDVVRDNLLYEPLVDPILAIDAVTESRPFN